MAPTIVTRESLLEKIRSRMPVVRDSWQLRHGQLDFWRPADPNALLDDQTLLNSHDELPWQPYWAQAWEASRGLCSWLGDRELEGLRVLEPGCGLGVTAAAALAGGARVVCGDNAPPALDFALLNTWPWRERCEVCFIDWHTTRTAGQFDLIAGSDIVYDRREVLPLNRFFRAHLRPGGRVVLSDPSRAMTREFLQMFADLGWSQSVSQVSSDGARQPTRIVEMQPAPPADSVGT